MTLRAYCMRTFYYDFNSSLPRLYLPVFLLFRCFDQKPLLGSSAFDDVCLQSSHLLFITESQF